MQTIKNYANIKQINERKLEHKFMYKLNSHKSSG